VSESARPQRSSNRLLIVGVAATVAPLILACAYAIGRTWAPTGDWAVAEVAVVDVFSADPPLLGAYSRLGWNHPGPALWWLLAPLYHLTGRQSWALMVGVGLVNLGSVALLLTYARRIAPTVLMLSCFVVMLQYTTFGIDHVVDPWNPWAAVLPFTALVMVGFAAWSGDRSAAVWTVVLASIVLQLHIGYALLVVPPVVCALWGIVRAPRDRRLLAVLGAALAVVWAPAVLDQLFGQANVSLIIESMAEQSGPAGLSVAIGQAADALSFGYVTWPPAVTLLAAGAVTVLVGMVAVRLRLRHHGALLVMTSALVVAGVASTARITGEVYAWLTLWWTPVALYWWLAVAWIVTGLVAVRAHSPSPLATRLRVGSLATSSIVLAVVAVAVVNWGAPLSEPPDAAGFGPVVLTASGAARSWAQSADDPVELGAFGRESNWAGDGIGAQLARRGVTFTVTDDDVNLFKWRAPRVSPPGERPVRQLWALTGRAVDHPDQLRALWPGATSTEVVFASSAPTPPRQALIAAEQRMFARLEQAGRRDLIVSYLSGDPPADSNPFPEVDRHRGALAAALDQRNLLLLGVHHGDAAQGARRSAGR
jgi:hypothetical protein